jgi:hypothetical protein
MVAAWQSGACGVFLLLHDEQQSTKVGCDAHSWPAEHTAGAVPPGWLGGWGIGRYLG